VHWSHDDIPSLEGKIAVVTGATSGLGREVARALAAKGATVILAGRNLVSGGNAAAECGTKASYEPLDLADLGSVRDFATRVQARHPMIDVLINNAGIALVPELLKSTNGFELQMATNYLGHFVLTRELLPALTASKAARVVSLSSIGAVLARMDYGNFMSERGYSPLTAYCRTKLAMLLFTAELEFRARALGSSLIALAAHPGVAVSGLAAAGPYLGRVRRIAAIQLRVTNGIVRVIGQSTAAGALPILRAATDPLARGGSYYGPAGFGGFKGEAVEVQPPLKSRDTTSAARLWRLSEQLTGATWPIALQ
jgi:NAD(P)-dependent dehydrogenase (short-subunit alcohol dehydrogenase family)